MFAWKLASVLLLACALIFHQPVTGGGPCNDYQKQEILRMCDPLKSTPIFTPARDGLCCKAVRRVPVRDMLCIAQLLSPLERAKYSAVKICSFKDACDWTQNHQGDVRNNHDLN
ncbi:hypothetical protein HU200_029389 [Digitaria exilis]|uniref:Bifunctional inhibitor/plant lipid transfer protein/seed storage helical domain-containing protein n=1 Tax=Digitaria exilis TaxID=1010633 RepID=A0A835ETA3_9POAL|nr:hypothetical protein HU200_029389 [Digitaria exilis]